jgi:hypothetical protein
MGLLGEDFVKHPPCIWLPLVAGRLTITVAFDNCGERIQECPRCVCWPLSRSIHFDTNNDAWRDQVSTHVAREYQVNIRAARVEPKFAAFLVSRVR